MILIIEKKNIFQKKVRFEWFRAEILKKSIIKFFFWSVFNTFFSGIDYYTYLKFVTSSLPFPKRMMSLSPATSNAFTLVLKNCSIIHVPWLWWLFKPKSHVNSFFRTPKILHHQLERKPEMNDVSENAVKRPSKWLTSWSRKLPCVSLLKPLVFP